MGRARLAGAMRVLAASVAHAMVAARPPPAEGRADAVAFEGGTIVAVGRREEVLAAAGPAAAVEDLGSAAIVPGFIDVHHHLSIGALYAGSVDCGRGVVALEDVAARLREAARTAAPGAWIVGHNLDETLLPDPRDLADRELLDAACPDNPVVLIHRTYHEAVVSSKALAALGIHRHIPDPYGGEIVRGRRGEPNGRLIERAMCRAEGKARSVLMARSEAEWIARVASRQAELFAMGLTRIADPTVPPAFMTMYRHARACGALELPVVMMPLVPGAQLFAPDEWAGDAPTGEGPEELRIGPAKLIFDGGNCCALGITFGDLSAILAKSVAHALSHRDTRVFGAVRRDFPRLGDDGRLHRGHLLYRPSEAAEALRGVVERGFGVAIHAAGNDGIGLALDAIETVRARHPAITPPRIEHALFLEEPLVRRIAELGICVAAQPGFLEFAAEGSVPPLPKRFIFLALRTLLDRGIAVAGSSDAPVLDPDPMHSLRAAVTRTSRDGRRFHAQEAIEPYEALRMYTAAAAAAIGCADVTGTLEPGKRADLVVLSADPLTDLANARVKETILGGKTVSREPS